jgi:hypothetical protein
LTIPGISEVERELMLECAKNQLKWLRDSQALFLKVRALVISQKHHLYKYDELEMCIARLALYEDGNYTPMRDQLFLNKAEVRQCSPCAVCAVEALERNGLPPSSNATQ